MTYKICLFCAGLCIGTVIYRAITGEFTVVLVALVLAILFLSGAWYFRKSLV